MMMIGRKKILIVEDDHANALALSAVLREHLSDYVLVNDGEECLDYLKYHPDICMVLLDLMMPGMDGYKTLEAIRSRDETREIPVIVVTARVSEQERIKCLEAGANEYVPKPVDIEMLINAMNRLCKCKMETSR